MPATVELTIRRLPDRTLRADARLTSTTSAAASQLAVGVPLSLDEQALIAASLNPTEYGTLLSRQLFADARLRDAWLKARARVADDTLQLRLNLDAGDAALQALRWETLRDPETDQPVALHEHVRLVRALDSADLAPVVIPPRPDLRALVVISNPSDLSWYGLAEVDVEGEVGRTRAALGDILTTILADHPDATGRATLANITTALRDGPQIVILVVHGVLRDTTPYLLLEREDGLVDRVGGTTFVEAVARLTTHPLFIVLASCRSAGPGYGDTLSALGPRLASAGAPAVLAFQGDVAMSTVKVLLPTLILELRRDGQIDRALAAARGALSDKRPWWQAILWLRTDGRLWEESAVPPTLPSGISIGGNVGSMQIVTVSGGSVGSIIGSQTNYGTPPGPVTGGRAATVSRHHECLAQHREILAHYLDQLAITGVANARPEVTAGIRKARTGIARAKAALAALGEAVEDMPDDVP